MSLPLRSLVANTLSRCVIFIPDKDHSVLLHPPHSIPTSPTPLHTAGCPATHARGGAMNHLNPARRYHGEHGVPLLPFLCPPPTLSPLHSSSPLSLSLSLLIQTQRATAMMFWKEFPPCPSSNPPSRWVHLHLECASFALIALGNVPPPLGAQSIRRSPTPLARASIQCPSLGE